MGLLFSARALIPVLLVGLVAATGCASSDDGSQAGDSFATSASDREIARIGGGGSFAVAEDGAYLVFDNGLFRVDAAGKKERVADAPDKAGELTVSGRFVVLEASPLSGDTLTFYDRTKGFEAKAIPLADRVVELLPAANDEVVVSFLDRGLVLFSAEGEKKTILKPANGVTVRDLQPGKTPSVLYGTMGGKEQQLVEIDIATGKSRVVLTIPEGSFAYVHDNETDTFFTKRSHISLPQESIVETFDAKGSSLAKLETPLNSFAMPVVDSEGFYLAARPGRSPGAGSWKLFKFDKKTLAMTDRGRVEPQVSRMELRDGELYYAHSKDAANPLRVRTR